MIGAALVVLVLWLAQLYTRHFRRALFFLKKLPELVEGNRFSFTFVFFTQVKFLG